MAEKLQTASESGVGLSDLLGVSAVSVKRCKQCDHVKVLSEFNTNETEPDGLRKNCRECQEAALKIQKRRAMVTKRPSQKNKWAPFMAKRLHVERSDY